MVVRTIANPGQPPAGYTTDDGAWVLVAGNENGKHYQYWEFKLNKTKCSDAVTYSQACVDPDKITL